MKKMIDPVASPGDPIFYLHHTWLDKVFWEWQALDLPARLTDMGGGNVQKAYFPFFPNGTGTMPPPGNGSNPIRHGWVPSPEDLTPLPDSPPQIPEGDNGGNVTTLSHVINMWGVVPNATIAEVMDIGGMLCYEYV